MNRLRIRSMTVEDLFFAEECTSSEGWVSENRATLEGFLFHDAAGCLLAELRGRQVGIVVATSYGHCGFIGELIVHPESRGLGIGASLLQHGVAYLQSCGARSVYLDGVIKAVGLYERNGFRKVCRSLRFSGKIQGKKHPQVRPMLELDLPAVIELDNRYFGARRSFFLKRRWNLFPELSQVLVDDGGITGYILGRRGESWRSAGPWVVEKGVQHPEWLLEAQASANSEQEFSIGVLATNRRAVEMIRSYGFVERADSPWRMVSGPDEDLGAAEECYAVGSAAKG